jgi:hypothetical protein
MIAWLVGIITFVLLVFIVWRQRSRQFYERCERPKYKLLHNLGIELQEDIHKLNADISEEETDAKRNS